MSGRVVPEWVHREVGNVGRAGDLHARATGQAQPTVTEDGEKAPSLKFGQPRVMALFLALTLFQHLIDGFRNRDLRSLVGYLLGVPVQRDAPVAERDHLQPWESVAALGVAEKDRQLVLDQLTAAVSEDGCRLIKHARNYWLFLAESHLTRRLFAAMVRRIAALPVATRQTQAMGAAKSGGQEVRVGGVSVECAEKTGFPGLHFSGRATTAPCGGEDGSRREKLQLGGGSKVGGLDVY